MVFKYIIFIILEHKNLKSNPLLEKKSSNESEVKSSENANSNKSRENSIYATPKKDNYQETPNKSENGNTRKENPYETVEYTNAVMEFDKMATVTPQNYKTSSHVSESDEEEFEPVEAPENEQQLFREQLNKRLIILNSGIIK